MDKLAKRHERFMADSMPVRLGGIAANLARIASLAGNPLHHQAILDMVDESKWFIEWAAPEADLDVAARLVEIQVSLALCELRMRTGADSVDHIAEAASAWSDEVLKMSGLLD
jgi:hypothetical protein